jgi:hypothetical protein
VVDCIENGEFGAASIDKLKPKFHVRYQCLPKLRRSFLLPLLPSICCRLPPKPREFFPPVPHRFRLRTRSAGLVIKRLGFRCKYRRSGIIVR